MLLAMLYDTRSIQLVKENIDSGTSEGITYAVELLDVFLSDQLKQRVIPVLDDLTDNERINKLDYYFPRVKAGCETGAEVHDQSGLYAIKPVDQGMYSLPNWYPAHGGIQTGFDCSAL
jgi:hypothetical protein